MGETLYDSTLVKQFWFFIHGDRLDEKILFEGKFVDKLSVYGYDFSKPCVTRSCSLLENFDKRLLEDECEKGVFTKRKRFKRLKK